MNKYSVDLSKDLSLDNLVFLYNCIDLEFVRMQLCSCYNKGVKIVSDTLFKS